MCCVMNPSLTQQIGCAGGDPELRGPRGPDPQAQPPSVHLGKVSQAPHSALLETGCHPVTVHLCQHLGVSMRVFRRGFLRRENHHSERGSCHPQTE